MRDIYPKGDDDSDKMEMMKKSAAITREGMSEEERKRRIIQRDVLERGRNTISAHQHFNTFVKPMHDKFVQPSINSADLILQGDDSLNVSVVKELLVKTFLKK